MIAMAGGGRRTWWRSLRALDVEIALRAALAAAVPLTVLAVAGRIDWASYAAFGGMVAIFGRGEPYRVRLRTVTTAALVQLAAIAAGVLLAAAGAPTPIVALALAGVIAVTIAVFNGFGVTPSGPLFAVFAVLVCAVQPVDDGTGWARFGVAAASAGFAWLLAMSGGLLRRLAPPSIAAGFKPLLRATPPRPRVLVDPRLWLNIAQNVVAGLGAGAVALAFGLGHPYWAVVTAVAVIPPARAAHTISRAWHRVLGTLAGVVVAVALLWPEPPVAVLIVAIALCQFGAELFVIRHYGTALVFVTPLALAVAHLASPASLAGLVGDRVLETLIGAAAGVVAVLAARRFVEVVPMPPPTTATPSIGPGRP